MHLKMLKQQESKATLLQSITSAATQALQVYTAYARSGFISLNERKLLKRLEAELEKNCNAVARLLKHGLTVQNEGTYHDAE